VPNWKYRDFLENQFVIAGSPATVRDQLMAAVKKLRVGNLMVLLHIGSMPHELTLKNIDLFTNEVLPHFRNVWDEDGWVNQWWPKRLMEGGKKMGAALGGNGESARASK
jgi:hypothetical protein